MCRCSKRLAPHLLQVLQMQLEAGRPHLLQILQVQHEARWTRCHAPPQGQGLLLPLGLASSDWPYCLLCRRNA